ncbi:MAG: MFS transporter, partial [Fibrobacterota bacterium]
MKNRRAVYAIAVVHLIHDVYSAFLPSLIPLLKERFGLSNIEISAMDVIRKVPALFNPLIALALEHTPFRIFLVISPLLTTLMMGLLGIAPAYGAVLVMLFTAGISSSLFHIPAPVAVKDNAGDKIGSGMSWYMFGGEIARTIGPLLITFFISRYGLKGSLGTLPFGLTASALIWWNIIRGRLHIAGEQMPEGSRESSRSAMDVEGRAIIIKRLAGIGAINLFRGGAKTSLTLFLPLYLKSRGYSQWFYAGVGIALYQAAGAAGTILSGRLSDRIGRRPLLIAVTGLAAFSLFALTFVENAAALVLLFTAGFAIFSFGPVLLTIVNSTKTHRSRVVNSIYMTINFGVSAFVSLMVGLMADHFGLILT